VKKNRLIYIILPLAFSFVVVFAILSYTIFSGLNIHPRDEISIIYIPEDASYEQVMDSIEACLSIKDKKILMWVAEKKNYPKRVQPGKYVIDNPMSYNHLINILRSGTQTPVRITFNNIRTLYELAGRLGGQIEADSSEIINFFLDPANYSKDGFKPENIISVFIPDTYEFYWNTGAGRFYNRMLREYKNFWNKERLQKSKEIGLTPLEVSTLASIVEEEAMKTDEKPRIAGVYLNRLKRGIPLQADPTIKFAINDFTVNRILYKHLDTDSPYNTYKYKGLPPGPIRCPSKSGLEAVLNAEKHDYIYFAARADFSGYHNFSRTLSDHNRYANQYQRELDKRNIFR
jgi:UPF0755 protein